MSTSVDIMINGRETVGDASNRAISGLARLNEALHGSQGKLKEFNTIMELAFGFHIGRFFFEKVHEGIAKLGEGFVTAAEKGKSFFVALEEGVRSAVGLKTATEELAEAQKKQMEVQEKLLRVRQGIAAEEALKGIPGARFHYFEGGGAREREQLAKLIEIRNEAYKNAAPGLAARASLEDPRTRWIEGISGAARGEATRAEIVEKYGPEIKAYAEADFELRSFLLTQKHRMEDMTNAPGHWPIANFLMGLAALPRAGVSALSEGIFQGRSLYSQALGTPLGFLRDLRQRQIEGQESFRDARLTAPEQARRQLAELNARGQLLTPEERKQAGYGILSMLYSAAGLSDGSTIGNVAAQNARFLTRGPGPEQNPVNELRQIKKDIEDLVKRQLPDLTKAIKAFIAKIGVAGA